MSTRTRATASRTPQSLARNAARAPDAARLVAHPIRAAIDQVLRSPGRPLDGATRGVLERGIGRVTAAPLPPPRTQRTPAIARADDPLEREADRVADQAVERAAGKAGALPAVPFRTDFSRVRIHSGPAASAAARALRAHAFSIGDDVVFGEGGYRPGTQAGLRLLAHELAHVAQRSAGRPMRKGMADQDLPPTPADAEIEDKDDAEAIALQTPLTDGVAAADSAAPGSGAGASAAPAGDATRANAPAAGAPAPGPGSAGRSALAPAPGTDAGTAPPEAASPKAAGDLPTSELGLIDEELAEHERWGAAAQKVGAAGSAERAAFIAEQAGEGSAKGLKEGAVQGAKMAVEMKIAEKLVSKAAVAVATRLGAQAAKFTPLPGVGAVIGGVMAGIDLAKRDWGATGKAVAGFGKGADVYEQLANSVEAISTVIEVATQVANVIAGILGAITVIMWIAAVATAGVISPMAATLTSISLAIGIGTMVLDGINAVVLKELITMFRALHAFASDADPRDVVAQGAAIEGAAGAATGFVGGLVGAKAAEKGMHFATPKPPPKIPGHPNPPAASGEGPVVKAEPPKEMARGAESGTPAGGVSSVPEPAAGGATRGVAEPSSATGTAASAPVPEPGAKAPPAAPTELAQPAAPAAPAKTIEVEAVPESVPAPHEEPSAARAPEMAGPTAEAKTVAPEKPAVVAENPAAVNEAPAATQDKPTPAQGKPAAQERPSAPEKPVPPTIEAPPEPASPGADRRKKGEAVWAATEQLGEKFAMDAGITPGDRIRLERRAATAKRNFEKKMAAAGYELAETGKEVSNRKWVPGKGKLNERRRAAAEASYKKEIGAIADKRAKLQQKARKDFFAGEQGPTTLDVEAWQPEVASGGPSIPITEPLVPDVTLPLSEPKRVGPGAKAEAGLMGRHSQQPPRGPRLISEHIGPGAQYEAISKGKKGPIYDESQYQQDVTLLADKEVADVKTHEGPKSDNKRTEALKAKAARGQRVDPIQDIYLPSIEQTFYAMDKVAQRRAQAAAAPGGGGASPPATSAGATTPAGPGASPQVAPHAVPGTPTTPSRISTAGPDLVPAAMKPAPVASEGSPVTVATGAVPGEPTATHAAPQAQAARPAEPRPTKPVGGSGGAREPPISEIEQVRLEEIGEKRRMVGGPPVERELGQGIEEQRPQALRRGEGALLGRSQVSDPVKKSLRRRAARDFGRLMQEALRDESRHTALTQETLRHLTPAQRNRVRRTGRMPEGFEFHHLMSIADYPEFGHLAESGLSLPKDVHLRAGHGGDTTRPLEAATLIDPGAMEAPGFTFDEEAMKGRRAKAKDVASGRSALSEKRGGIDADLITERKFRIQELKRRRRPEPGDAAQIARLESEITTIERLIAQRAAKPAASAAAAGKKTAVPAAGGAQAASAANEPFTSPVAAQPGLDVDPDAPAGGVASAPNPLAPKATTTAVAPTATPASTAPATPAPTTAPLMKGEAPASPAAPSTTSRPPAGLPAIAPSSVPETVPTAPARTAEPGGAPRSAPVASAAPATGGRDDASRGSSAQGGGTGAGGAAPQSSPAKAGAPVKEAPADQPTPKIESTAPIVERVNPAYQAPPGTPDDLVSLRNQIIDTLEARAAAERYAQAMGAQKQQHEANEKPLADMKDGTGEAITATEAHQKAVANRDEANERKKAEENKTRSKVDDYASRAGRLTSLTVPLKGLAKFTGLARSLPGEPDFVLRFRNGVLKMNSDANKFLAQLDQMDSTMTDQKAQQAERQKGVEADAATLKQTDDKAKQSAQGLKDAKESTEDFDQKNKERKEDASSQQKGAQQTAGKLGAKAKEKEQQAVSLAAAMQYWARGHAKARAGAIEQTRKRLIAMGYRVTEVREKGTDPIAPKHS